MKTIGLQEIGMRTNFCRALLCSMVLFVAISSDAKPSRDPTDIDLGGGYITDMGFVNAGDHGEDFTNASFRTMAVSVGQLGGVNPETGDIIVNEGNLLPLVSRNLDVTGNAYLYTNVYVAGSIYSYGAIYGNGLGITNIPIQNITGLLTERPEIRNALNAKLDSTGVWESIDTSSASIADLQAVVEALDTSIADTNNPHHVTASQAGALPVAGGTMSGSINMGGIARVTNLPNPVNDLDAVSKAYVDQRLSYVLPQGDIGMGIYTNAP